MSDLSNELVALYRYTSEVKTPTFIEPINSTHSLPPPQASAHQGSLSVSPTHGSYHVELDPASTPSHYPTIAIYIHKQFCAFKRKNWSTSHTHQFLRRIHTTSNSNGPEPLAGEIYSLISKTQAPFALYSNDYIHGLIIWDSSTDWRWGWILLSNLATREVSRRSGLVTFCLGRVFGDFQVDSKASRRPKELSGTSWIRNNPSWLLPVLQTHFSRRIWHCLEPMSEGFRDSESTSKRRGGRYERVSFRGGCSFPTSLYRRHAISITIMPTQTGTAPAFLCGPKCIYLHLFPYSELIVSNFRPCLEPGFQGSWIDLKASRRLKDLSKRLMEQLMREFLSGEDALPFALIYTACDVTTHPMDTNRWLVVAVASIFSFAFTPNSIPLRWHCLDKKKTIEHIYRLYPLESDDNSPCPSKWATWLPLDILYTGLIQAWTREF